MADEVHGSTRRGDARVGQVVTECDRSSGYAAVTRRDHGRMSPRLPRRPETSWAVIAAMSAAGALALALALRLTHAQRAPRSVPAAIVARVERLEARIETAEAAFAYGRRYQEQAGEDARRPRLVRRRAD